jgi:hypothetical protein
MLITFLTHRTWRWRQSFAPKHWQNITELNFIASQKKTAFHIQHSENLNSTEMQFVQRRNEILESENKGKSTDTKLWKSGQVYRQTQYLTYLINKQHKKFWEQLFAYFKLTQNRWNRKRRLQQVFFAAETCLPLPFPNNQRWYIYRYTEYWEECMDSAVGIG